MAGFDIARNITLMASAGALALATLAAPALAEGETKHLPEGQSVQVETRPGADPLDANSSADWGPILTDNDYCSQASAWFVGFDGFGGAINGKLWEAHSPRSSANVGPTAGFGKLVDVTWPSGETRVGLGTASGLYARTYNDKLPDASGNVTVDAPCSARADVGIGSADLGLPYFEAATAADGVPLSPFGIHINGINGIVQAEPGKPVKMTGSLIGGWVSIFGNKVFDFPGEFPANFGVTFAPFGQFVLKEQVTTGSDGMPTKDASGNYRYDPNASSGYSNAFHGSILGRTVGDLTIIHGAALTTATPSPIQTPGSGE